VRFTLRKRNGRTVVPLTRQPGGIRVWKAIIPPQPGEPELRTHERNEWLYVLADRVRLLLGDPRHHPGPRRSRQDPHPGAALVRAGP
jgi:hypothetical protein